LAIQNSETRETEDSPIVVSGISDSEKQLQQHKQEYRACCPAYESDIEEAKVFASDASTLSFDFQQVVEIPSMPQQPSQWYYWTPFKLYVFGIVNDAIDQHYHAIFTEAQQGKGANQVVSILHCFLTSIKQLTPKVHLWADNRGGQNKNKTMLWYLSWLVATQDIEEIILGFQIKGDTRNRVDHGIGTVKQKANRTEVWTPEMYAKLVDTTDKAAKIKAVLFFDDPTSTMFSDWDTVLSSYLRILKGIQQYHFFRFASLSPGIEEVKRLPQDEWIKIV